MLQSVTYQAFNYFAQNMDTHEAKNRVCPERKLLLAFLRRDYAGNATKTLINQPLDWDLLLRVAVQHGVMPLLYRNLNAAPPKDAPAEFLERLQQLFFQNLRRNDTLTAELCDILRLTAHHGIPVVPYKGPALALILYGDTALRQFSDLDLLIRKCDIERTFALLETRGYRRQFLFTPRQQQAFIHSDCEMLLMRDPERFFLDVHWNFTPLYWSLRFDSEMIWQRLGETSINGTSTLAFHTEDLLIILCIHAAKDFWSSLGLLVDIAEVVTQNPDLDWARVSATMHAARATHIVLLSLSLAHELLGAPLPLEIKNRITAERTIMALNLKITRDLLLHVPTSKDGGQYPLSAKATARYLRRLCVVERIADKCKFCARLAVTPTSRDYMLVSLPRQLHFGYYLMRPFRLFAQYATKFIVRGKNEKHAR